MTRRLSIYLASNGREPFTDFMESLRDQLAVAKIKARVRRAELRNLGDYSSVGQGVIELRIHYGPGYRVYIGISGADLVILCAGMKNTQEKDIESARRYWTVYRNT